MTRHNTIAIVGAGLAGATAAQTLREEGYHGRVVLLGAERERPYERVALSKDVLRGERPDASVYVHDARFYDDHAIELRSGAIVESVDVGTAEVVVGDGERVRYDKLLLATGARPRRPSLPGADLDAIHELRTVADCAALRDRLRPGARTAIVGAGWIGAEVAASARASGVDVTVVETTSVPLERALGREVGAIFRDLHAEHGVRMLLGRRLAAFEGDGAVGAVCTADGARIACDFVVLGAGVTPRTEIAWRAGIDVVNGIVVDEYLQTSAPGVFAAGDVATASHPLFERSIRIEHADTARHQGATAARNMLGAQVVYERLPYFRSEQYGVAIELSGHAPSWDEIVIRGDPRARELISFWLRDERVIAAMSMNVWGVTDDVRALIRSCEPVDPRRLADPGVPLSGLLPATARRG